MNIRGNINNFEKIILEKNDIKGSNRDISKLLKKNENIFTNIALIQEKNLLAKKAKAILDLNPTIKGQDFINLLFSGD